jgi:hypothetical protein
MLRIREGIGAMAERRGRLSPASRRAIDGIEHRDFERDEGKINLVNHCPCSGGVATLHKRCAILRTRRGNAMQHHEQWHWANDRCEPTLSSWENPCSYVPTGWLGLTIFKWEMQQQPYKHPESTVAYEFKDEAGEAPRQKGQAQTKMPGMEMQVIKPGGTAGHKGHHKWE